MAINFLLRLFEENKHKTAFIWNDNSYTYSWLLNNIKTIEDWLLSEKIKNSTISIESPSTPFAIAVMLAIFKTKNIAIPITTENTEKISEMLDIAEVEYRINIDNEDINIFPTNKNIRNSLLLELRHSNNPGLILFSSGTTGKVKAALHDISRLMVKYKVRRHDLRTLVFMYFDHIGGIDTILYSLSNTSTIITPSNRSPETICKTIEKYKAEVLPTTPTFLYLLLISKAYEDYNLSSLKYITYGTEVMPETTLKQLNTIFPNIKIIQKYGTTEIGTMRSHSMDSDSLWVKLGGEGYKTRIKDGLLEIKAKSAMKGYLNAPSPFTEDGWYKTGDKVEEKDGFYRIIGRESEIINVGGEKVNPYEVEDVILKIDGVQNVVVYSIKNPILGNIVATDISMQSIGINKKEIKQKIKRICSENLENYKIPVKINITTDSLHTERYKKNRKRND